MRLPQKPPPFDLSEFDFTEAQRGQATDEKGRYLPWDEMRRKEPVPNGWTHEQWWWSTRFARSGRAEMLLRMGDLYGSAPHYVLTDDLRRRLHALDRNPVNRVLLELVDDPESLTEFRVRELIEEAIDSSMIEGAKPTTRDHARDLIVQGRNPATRSEKMIVNNWRAMQRLLELRETGVELDRDALLDLHRILGQDALESERPAGQFRELEDITVEDAEGVVWHRAPAREGLEARVDAILRFAQPREGDPFVHPIVRAVLSHFWLAYEHPFCDGNGRAARALYYWVMLREGYEVAEYLSISGAIRKRGNRYYRAFAYCEAEDLDLTYFLIDQLASLESALQNLVARLRARKQRAARMREIIADFDGLNHRQRALMDSAVRHPHRIYTVGGHQTAQAVSYLTARKDLKRLVGRGLLAVRRVGREDQFTLSPDVRKNANTRRG